MYMYTQTKLKRYSYVYFPNSQSSSDMLFSGCFAFHQLSLFQHYKNNISVIFLEICVLQCVTKTDFFLIIEI